MKQALDAVPAVFEEEPSVAGLDVAELASLPPAAPSSEDSEGFEKFLAATGANAYQQPTDLRMWYPVDTDREIVRGAELSGKAIADAAAQTDRELVNGFDSSFPACKDCPVGSDREIVCDADASVQTDREIVSGVVGADDFAWVGLSTLLSLKSECVRFMVNATIPSFEEIVVPWRDPQSASPCDDLTGGLADRGGAVRGCSPCAALRIG